MAKRKRDSIFDEDDLARLNAPFPRGVATSASKKITDENGAVRVHGKSKYIPAPLAKRSVARLKKHYLVDKKEPADDHKIHSLRKRELRLGTLVLAQVGAVSQDELSMALPNGLSGRVKLEDGTGDVYEVGSWLRCAVVSLGDHRSLELSIEPSLVNNAISSLDWRPGMTVQARVESLEDHGAILDFGSASGFMSNENMRAPLKKNQILLTHIVENGRIHLVTSKPDYNIISSALPSSLVPGILVEALVLGASAQGLKVAIFGTILASADFFHANANGTLPQVGSTVHARVTFLHPSQFGSQGQIIGLSVLSHVLGLSKSKDSQAFEIGQFVQGRIKSVDDTSGLFVDIGLDNLAWVPTNLIDDKFVANLSSDPRYKEDTVHTGRILRYLMVEDCYKLSLAPSLLARPYVSLEDLPVGSKLEGVKLIKTLPKGGYVVEIGPKLMAFASEFHLTDAHVMHPESMLKPGQVLPARVLMVDPVKGLAKVTLKPSLVDAENVTVLNVQSANTGDELYGTIINIRKNSAQVEFYGGWTAILPRKEMSEARVEDPSELFHLGQTVKVRIVSLDKQTGKCIVSCKMVGNESPLVEIGSIVRAVISEKTKNALIVDFENERGLLPVDHLSDIGTAKDLRLYEIGSELDVVVLDRKSSVLVSTKPALLKAAKAHKFPKDFNDLRKGEIYAGYIVNQTSAGTFVSFANHLTGLVPSHGGQQSALVNHQSVLVRVVKIDNDRKRFYLSFIDDEFLLDTSVPVGEIKTARVVGAEKNYLKIQVESKNANIPISELFSSLREVKPLAQFENAILSVRQLELGTKEQALYTARKDFMTNGDPRRFRVGDRVLAFVSNVHDTDIEVTLTSALKGNISQENASNDYHVYQNLKANFSPGDALEAKITQLKPLRLTLCDSSILHGVISRVSANGLRLRIGENKAVTVGPCDTSDEYKSLQGFHKGDTVLAKLLDSKRATLRLSELFSNSPDPKDKLIIGVDDVEVGDVIRGFVKSISNGIFVSIGRNLVGRVQIGEISDAYLKDWSSGARVGELVTTKVIAKKEGRLELTMKQSVITGTTPERQPGLEKIEEGTIHSGIVTAIKEFGIFVQLSNTQVTGLCHRLQIADQIIEEFQSLFSLDDKVKVKVLKVDLEKRHLSLGMKASYFDQEGDAYAQKDDSSSDGAYSDDAIEIDEVQGGPIANASSQVLELSESDNDEENKEELDFEKPGLSAKFEWDADGATINYERLDDSSSDSTSENSDDESDVARRARTRRKEEFIEDVTADIQNRMPQSAKDFERLLVANPNSSVLWVSYMAFRLQLGEVDAARAVGRRALKTLRQDEIKGKLTLWVAMLNLEVTFGTPESTMQLFREACQFNDSCTIHLKMATIYNSANKSEDAKRVYASACKRFGTENLDVWVSYARFLYEKNNAVEARKLLDRATQRLPKRLHRDLAVQIAKLEFQLGEAEYARTLFEAMVSGKRLDLWNVYIDQEIKHDPTNRKQLTNLFERVLKSRLSMHQAKSIFKKWLAYEVEHGDSKGAEYVKARAAEHVKVWAQQHENDHQ